MAQKQNKPSELDSRFQVLLTFIALLKDARHKAKKSELEFLMVNQTFNLVRYRHCVYWEWNGEAVSVVAMSGLVHIDPAGPYVQWLKKVMEGLLKGKMAEKTPVIEDAPDKETFSILHVIKREDCAKAEQEEWEKWVSGHARMVVMKDRHGKIFGGLWIDRNEPFEDLEMAILEDLADGYAHALHRFGDQAARRKMSGWKSIFSLSRSNLARMFIILCLVMLLPVRMSATAPAEIVARKPAVVSVPFDGVIEKIEVVPGQAVKKGDVLVHMDSTVLGNKREIAASEAQAAEIALRKTERESLTDRSKLADIAILKAQLEQKTTEMRFAGEMLEKSEIKADRDGIVIFSDPNAMRGKPVHTGEQIMLLADPQDNELLIRVPVESMIEINEDVSAKFFLNVMPVASREATYESIGYQATPDPDGLVTYKVRAKFAEGEEPPRIGWTGTGKVYGDRTLLVFNILRRPIVALRRKLGL